MATYVWQTILSDGFEDGLGNWTPYQTDGTFEQSSEQAHSGTYSAKGISNGDTVEYKHDFDEITSGKFSMTAWVYAGTKEGGIIVRNNAGEYPLWVKVDAANSALIWRDTVEHTGSAVTTGQWYKLVVEIDLDNSTYSIWMDDNAEASNVSFTVSNIASAGIWTTNSGVAYFDDVLLEKYVLGPKISGTIKEKESDISGKQYDYVVVKRSDGSLFAAGTAATDGTYSVWLQDSTTEYDIIALDSSGVYNPKLIEGIKGV